MGRVRMFGARLWARMPPEYLVALKAFAFQSGVPLAEYVRGMVHDHILERGAGLRERGAALRALINAGKAWVIAYHETGKNTKMPDSRAEQPAFREATTTWFGSASLRR